MKEHHPAKGFLRHPSLSLSLYETFSLLSIAVLIAGCLAQPYFESRAYNRLTGAHTTYWDALWLSLRVQEQPLKQTQP